MYKNEEIEEMREYASLLSKGIDPTTGMKFIEDTILNNAKVKRYNKKVVELIDDIFDIDYNNKRNNKSTTNKKHPFFLTESDIKHFEYSIDPISISQLTYKINGIISTEMRKIRAIEITNWLKNNNYLEVLEFGSDKVYKKATDKGVSIGIVFVKKINDYGNEYGVNLYSREAQTFIINNINEIISS